MKIRSLEQRDLGEARRIFNKYYAQAKTGELEFPDMRENYLCCYVVEDDNGRIVTLGGVRMVAEVTLMTDKARSARSRVAALWEVLRASSFIAKQFKFDWLHAVTDEPTWANQLKESGFVPRGESLQIHVGDIK